MTTFEEATNSRKPGFYWVRDGEQWTIALWRRSSFPKGWIAVIGNTEFDRDDSDFSEIDENRIVRN
jgi:hypothetical protein